jgi:type II secretory pathway pseudopilin PulG
MKRRAHRGFTYITAIFVVALMGAGYATIGEMWHNATLRQKEADLLYVGNQYRDAIARYYQSGPSRYPRALEDLLKDPRMPTTQRYLRKLYPDPVTGTSEWGMVKAPDGGIMGVHSRSEAPPIKKTGFKLRDRDFEAAKTYTDWKFLFTPVLQPGATPTSASGTPTPTAPPATPAVKP